MCDAGDVYNYDLMMGLPEFDLSGHWRDELVKLKAGVTALEKERMEFHPEARSVVGRYYLGAGAPPAGYQRVSRGTKSLSETNGSNLVVLDVPDGRYQVTVGIHDDKASHGPCGLRSTESSTVTPLACLPASTSNAPSRPL